MEADATTISTGMRGASAGTPGRDRHGACPMAASHRTETRQDSREAVKTQGPQGEPAQEVGIAEVTPLGLTAAPAPSPAGIHSPPPPRRPSRALAPPALPH